LVSVARHQGTRVEQERAEPERYQTLETRETSRVGNRNRVADKVSRPKVQPDIAVLE
jgi:hypothetical protein